MAPTRLTVQVPCYRADIMHDWDIFEDVAIVYGYENLQAMPPGNIHGRETQPVQMVWRISRVISSAASGTLR